MIYHVGDHYYNGIKYKKKMKINANQKRFMILFFELDCLGTHKSLSVIQTVRIFNSVFFYGIQWLIISIEFESNLNAKNNQHNFRSTCQNKMCYRSTKTVILKKKILPFDFDKCVANNIPFNFIYVRNSLAKNVNTLHLSLKIIL